MHLSSLIPQSAKQLLLALVIIALASPVLAAEYVCVNKDGVSVRSGPETTKKNLLWEVYKDFPLQVIKRQKEWVQIKDFEGDSGWISANRITKAKRVIVKANSVKMRSEPKKDAPLVATVKYGVVFTPLEKKGEWLKVKHEDGSSGWIVRNQVWPSDIL